VFFLGKRVRGIGVPGVGGRRGVLGGGAGGGSGGFGGGGGRIMTTTNERKVIELEQGWAFMQKGITKLKNLLEGVPEQQFNSEEYIMLYTYFFLLSLCPPSLPVCLPWLLYATNSTGFFVFFAAGWIHILRCAPLRCGVLLFMTCGKKRIRYLRCAFLYCGVLLLFMMCRKKGLDVWVGLRILFRYSVFFAS
jgi:hypothetical protein